MFKAEEEIKEFLDKIYIPSDFGYDIDNEDDYYILRDWWNDIHKTGLELKHGCTKAVIIGDNWDCCIKIGFNGYCEVFYDDDGEEEAYDFVPFSCAPGENPSNYADAEYYFYKILNDNGFGILMPQMKYYGMVDGNNVYLQEKVETLRRRNGRHPSVASVGYVHKISKDKGPIGTYEWDANIVDTYGREFYDAFYKFTNEYSIFSTDMHGENIGYALDGRPVILDVGGFEEMSY